MDMASHVQPRVTKRHEKLHLSYELPHRIHCSLISPLTAPNGSTLIFYGHQNGLRILWRGGRRRRRQNAAAHSNGTNGMVELLDDEEFEDNEEEQDPDCPHPSIIQHLSVDFGNVTNPVAILHLATTSITNNTAAPHILKDTAIVAAASSDGKLRLLLIPLSPPSDHTKEQTLRDIVTSAIEIDLGTYHVANLPASLAVKFLAHEHQRSNALIAPNGDVEGFLLLVSAGRTLHTWTIPVTADAIVSEDIELLHKISLPSPATAISPHPSPRTSQLLLVDATSAVRIYEPLASPTPRRRPGSSDSTSQLPSTVSKPGRWITTFHPAFQVSKGVSAVSAAFARRKKVLDAKWILGGRAALALLEDGEWGIWDVTSPPKGKSVEEFALNSFLDTAARTETAEPAKQRQGAARLAPSTPNTRKAKQDQLFSGTPKTTSNAAPRGGISVSPYSIKAGAGDESVVMWYNGQIYSIPSIGRFWQQGTSGGLYSSSLTHIPDVNLMQENITGISQFASKTAGSGIGSMNTQRDLLVSAEHRAIILQGTRPPTPSRQLFHAAERPVSRDQQMFDSGELDLDGIDNMLDSMAAPARRVGFLSPVA
ncbi:hypothetical protein AC578_743 [Pseudocercospora eumusae]|uniref:Uncharacterized protein n=1 Tax=Pseudocercospora eumusae TaxID=321146 RepID=A0A139HN07_9PEZI|nr:hypothetical protein AC578_743 [Pseudocercospora eumusae]